MKLVKKIVEEYHIDIINAQSSKDRYITIFVRLFFGVKSKLFHTRRQYPLSSGGYLQRQLYVKGTDKIIVISNELKRIFITKGFPENHLQVIHNGIPIARYKQWDNEVVSELRIRFGINENDIVIGCISRLKRQEQLIRALAILNRPEVKVLFVGIKNGYFDSLCKELGVKNKIIYAGDVPPDKVLNYYRLLTINILASISDGFGLVLLEAMAMGTPVIATQSGGIIDVVKHELNGLLFNDGDIVRLRDNIIRLLDDSQLKKLVISNGHLTVQDFSMDKTILNYESFFSAQLRLIV